VANIRHKRHAVVYLTRLGIGMREGTAKEEVESE